jgi:acetyl-CoA synthetase
MSAKPPVAERLDQLLEVATFEPSARFTAAAQVSDDAVYAKAAADGPAWWAAQARQRLSWATPFSSVLDDSNPPFYTWFADGTLNVVLQLPGPAREAGHGDRVAFHWAGEEGEQRDDHLRRAALATCKGSRTRSRTLGVGKGDVVGIYLPMIPEVVVSMLACARIGAPHNVVFGGFAPRR